MLKIYKSDTDISFNVTINGESVHISFSPLTKSGSVFYTEEKELQDAIESTPYFGSLYYLFKESGETGKNKTPKNPKPVKKMTIITVDCLDDAKEYLADRFGVSRTAMRNKDDILEHAATYKIIFKGPDFE